MKQFKDFALQMLLWPGAASLFSPLTRRRAVVFMLHRFRGVARAREHEGHDVATLRRALAYLRRRKHRVLPIDELLRLAARDAVPNGAVAFTIDDGYADQATIGAPVFAEFDCPVTTFVTTGFLDRQLWFWWDRIEYVFTTTRLRWLRVRLGEDMVEYRWESLAERAIAQVDFETRCKSVSDEEKTLGIEHLAEEAGVALPETAPDAYAPMTWDQLRECERRGMSFGAHTVTHPILSRVSDERSRWELSESWRRLRDEAAKPVPVFCYPNGLAGDYSQREIRTLEQLGFLGSVVGSGGFVSGFTAGRDASAPFAIRRFGFPNDAPHFVQFVSGAERAKSLLRGGVV